MLRSESTFTHGLNEKVPRVASGTEGHGLLLAAGNTENLLLDE